MTKKITAVGFSLLTSPWTRNVIKFIHAVETQSGGRTYTDVSELARKYHIPEAVYLDNFDPFTHRLTVMIHQINSTAFRDETTSFNS